ncbi:G/U mismatch-specific uracil-DNA glycosylase [Sphingomonas guangdongensis]|uniref:G/U mismatch-specific uracil-DNA glycosylase n=1 Tax=Sphingomonas guangdongensis TaxID=1141890 RepID=A0A285R2F9_9SPHN|nr:G/U mismatch-specific uracil-DNA glycosylase [Sphingomonas guangdongensis]
MTVKHSFPPVTDARTRVLVCGSLPGEASLRAARYYAHPQNQFWRLTGAVIDLDLASLDYAERLAALLAHGIGLWDVVASATRIGSSDAAIRAAAPNDLPAFAVTLPSLRAVGFNGGTALRLGRAQLGKDTRYAVVALPSSSPLHTIPFSAKLPAWLSLRAHLDGGRGDAKLAP